MTDLRGKTALVTGSTSGIGKATATALAARGAHVLVVGRNEQRAKDVVAEIEGSGGSATFRLTTLSDLESARELVEWATEAGDGHVDILINNAGVALLGPSSAATEAGFVRWGLALSQSFERVHSNEPVLRLPDVSMFGLAASTVLHGGFGLSAIHGDVRPLEEASEIMLQV